MKKIILTKGAMRLNITAVVCFIFWFFSLYATFREDIQDDGVWPLLVGFTAISLTLRLIPLAFLPLMLSSSEYAEFWALNYDDRSQKQGKSNVYTKLTAERCVMYVKTVMAGLIAFLYAWVFFLMINKSTILCLIGILSFTLEGFCVAELFKVGPVPALALEWAGGGAVDFGYFKYVVANAICTTQRLFGLASGYVGLVFVFCLILVTLHNNNPRNAYCEEDNKLATTIKYETNHHCL